MQIDWPYIGKRISTKRGDEPQAAFAQRVGVSASAISAWERGTKPIPQDRLLQIEKILGFVPGELVDLTKVEKKPSQQPVYLQYLIDNLEKLEPMQLTVVTGLVREFIKATGQDVTALPEYDHDTTVVLGNIGKIKRDLERTPNVTYLRRDSVNVVGHTTYTLTITSAEIVSVVAVTVDIDGKPLGVPNWTVSQPAWGFENMIATDEYATLPRPSDPAYPLAVHRALVDAYGLEGYFFLMLDFPQ